MRTGEFVLTVKPGLIVRAQIISYSFKENSGKEQGF